MKVSELIEKLQACPPNAEVWIPGQFEPIAVALEVQPCNDDMVSII